MPATRTNIGLRYTLLLCVCLLWMGDAFAQQAPAKADTANKVKVIIANAGTFEFFKTDTGSYNKFITDVIMYQGTDTLYCDSLYQFTESKKMEAFGDVRIAQQGGTEGTSNYLRYMSDTKLAFMQGNVSVTDGENKLWSEELTYDLGAKVGTYSKTGTLQSDSTIVTSDEGVYNVRSHDARFTGHVVVTDPKYKITSKDLGYNTETKVETFFAPSTVTSDSGRSILVTSNGTYDSKNVVAHFIGHSSIWNDGQYIEADSLHYNKLSGYGFAIGNVISIDTTQHATIYCGRADYFRKQRVLWATIKPVLEQVNGKDTFYMRADTFYTAPMVKGLGHRFIMPQDREDTIARVDSTRLAADTALVKSDTISTIKKVTTIKKASIDTATTPVVSIDTGSNGMDSSLVKSSKRTKSGKDSVGGKLKQKPLIVLDTVWQVPAQKFRLANFYNDTTLKLIAEKVTTKPGRKSKGSKAIADTAAADTTAPLFFIGYHHVLIFSDSMQAKCDSVSYTRSDSMIRMLYNPIAWSRNSQITGDTILMQMDSSSIKCMYVPDKAFVVSQSGPEQAQLWDQIQGKTLTAFMKDNTIKKMIVVPDAESIYYSKDDDGAYVGLNEANSELMRIFFDDQKIKKIKFEKDVKQTMTPLDKADLPNAKLSRFRWLQEERPKSKEELFQ